MDGSGRARLLVRAAALWLVPLAACGGAASNSSGGVRAAARASVDVPGADRFAPFIIAVARGSEVTFHNADSDTHTVVSVPGDDAALDLTLAPGQTLTVTLHSAGVHRYFCSIHAHYDPATGQVAANADADHPNEPMQGVLVVT